MVHFDILLEWYKTDSLKPFRASTRTKIIGLPPYKAFLLLLIAINGLFFCTTAFASFFFPKAITISFISVGPLIILIIGSLICEESKSSKETISEKN